MKISIPIVNLQSFLAPDDSTNPQFEQCLNDNIALQHTLLNDFPEVTLMLDEASVGIQAWAVTPKSKRNRKVQIGLVREDYVETLFLNYPNLSAEPLNVAFKTWMADDVFSVEVDITNFALPELASCVDVGPLRGIQMPVINEAHLDVLNKTFSRCNEIAQTLPVVAQEDIAELVQFIRPLINTDIKSLSFEERRVGGMLLRLLESVASTAEASADLSAAIAALNQSLALFYSSADKFCEIFTKEIEYVSSQMKPMFSKMDGYNSIGITSYENLYRANEEWLKKIPSVWEILNEPQRNDKQEAQMMVDLANALVSLQVRANEYYLLMVHLITREYLLEKYSGISPEERRRFRKMSIWSKDLSISMLVQAVVELRQTAADNPLQIPSHMFEVLTRMGKEKIVDIPFRKTPQILTEELSQIVGVDLATYTMKQYLKRLCK